MEVSILWRCPYYGDVCKERFNCTLKGDLHVESITISASTTCLFFFTFYKPDMLSFQVKIAPLLSKFVVGSLLAPKGFSTSQENQHFKFQLDLESVPN